MLKRPETLGLTLKIESVEDVNAALQEMAWLTARQQSIEADAAVKIAALQTECNAKLIVEVEDQTVTIKDRWDALHTAVQAWCEVHLKESLPANKRSLKLSHGEIKLRALAAAAGVLEGKKPDDVALTLARDAGALAKADKLLAVTIPVPPGEDGQEHEPIALSNLIALQFVIDKAAVKKLWDKRPEIRDFLRTLSIIVEEGKEQITLVPAAQQIATTEE